MHNKINLLGQRFGRLEVLAEVPIDHGGKARWLCRCDCGKETVQYGSNLRRSLVVSCGCHRNDLGTARFWKHGLSTTVEYKTWRRMIARCSNPNMHNFAFYGGRGITICEHWRNDFLSFLAAVGHRPSPQYSIDKDTPGGDGHYHCTGCGGNVRWATREEQQTNRRPRTRR